jgi:branched-chain amino acid transport system ATP-binding protein
MEALRIEGLSKNFGALEVLKGISLRVEKGEHVAVIGPNGAGKTTLLNVVSGELPADAGHVHVFGQDITSMPVHRRVHMGLARSFQLTRVFGSLSLLQNTLLAIQGMKPSRFQMIRSAFAYGEYLAEAEKLLNRLGLWAKRNALARTISYGERRKLEIALSLALEPKVLLLDEPSAGLDLGEIRDFIDFIKDIAREMTLVFAAHDMDVVFGLAHRVVVLYYGQFIADGTPEEIRAHPKVREIYLGVK